jgi:PAS domain S-box-containing protein
MTDENHPPTPTSGGHHTGSAVLCEAALEAMPDAVLVLDADGVVLLANRACRHLLDRDIAEIVGRRTRTLVPADLRASHVERRRYYTSGLDPQRISDHPIMLMERRDGSPVGMEVSLAPFETATGRYITMVIRPVAPAHSPPIRASMRSAQQLARSERTTRMGSWEEDIRTGRGAWSQGMYDLLGLPEATVSPGMETLLGRLHPDDLPPVIAEHRRALTHGGEWSAEARLAVPATTDPEQDDPERAGTEQDGTEQDGTEQDGTEQDGTEQEAPDARDQPGTTVSIRGRVELDRTGAVVASAGTVQDVSARVRLERQVRAGALRLQMAVDHSPIGFALVDVRPGHPPRRLSANPALAEMMGVSIPELLERPMLESVHPLDRERHGAFLRRVVDGEIPAGRSVESRVLRPDGQERWVSASGAVVRDSHGRPDYMIAHMVDITERKRAQGQAEAAAARQARIASVLQDGLHPYVPHRVGPVEIASRYQPAGIDELVGGDWTDVFTLSTGRIGIVVGDVAGHGVQAAATMTRLRTLVRMLATSGTSPAGVMRRLNDVLHDTDIGEDIDLATLVHAQLDPSTGTLVYCSAGHLPLLALPNDRAGRRRLVTPVPAVGGPPIGVQPDLRFTEGTLTLEPGSLLIGYTDGLIERRGHSIDQSLLTLQNSINELPASTLADVDALAEAVMNLAPGGAAAAPDDIAVIVLNFDPPTRRLPHPAGTETAPAHHDNPTKQYIVRPAVNRLDLDDVALPPSRWTRS